MGQGVHRRFEDAATITGDQVKSIFLPQLSPIFASELYAISLAVNIIAQRQNGRNVIFSDSKSVLQSLAANPVDNAMAKQLRSDIYNLNKVDKNVNLCWIPCHVDIRGNEMADRHAKTATSTEPKLIPIPYSDEYFFPHIRKT